jgi:PEP-CTERM/exosortase A-associated glycosyltransferase
MMGEIAHRLEEVVKRHRPHILHAHSPVLNAIPALRIGRRVDIPIVYEMRASWEDAAVNHGTAKANGLRYRLSRALETWALKHADAVTTICEGLRNDITDRGIPKDKVTVIPNAVDVEAFRVTNAPDTGLKRHLGLNDAIVLGFIGSFYAYEGLDVLLRALPQLIAQNLSIRVLLVGGGPQEAELRRLADELRVGDRVTFAGRVPHDEVKCFYDVIDVLIYPRLSIRLTETVTPLKPLEAMAQGRLLIASDVGGHREIIRPGQTGILFKAGDSDALARAVLDLIQQPERWAALKASARQYVERERNWSASVAGYKDVYGSLVSMGRV